MHARRRLFLLRSAALLPVLPLLLPRRAHAFTTEDLAGDSPLGLAIANRCADSPEHAAIAADLERELAGRGAPSGTTLRASATCPVCGCPVDVSYKVP